ncbi:hypothetical protein CVT26_004561 [Gymnopilus dilepis]|uniref:F-box domain-containing protein n=1 Tax=Gymnopilus dilepis TaxID=231916 RepID=A0A409YJ40_9AGAR|nr:hypothetical protein CVT26_004561 [Gymnopilus dilepis]
MVDSLFELDPDSLSLIYDLLDSPALRALSNSSREGFERITPLLVRKVQVSRWAVLPFCKFALKYGLSSHIISLRFNLYTVTCSGYYDPNVIAVLDQASNLKHFTLLIDNDGFATPAKMFPSEKLPTSLLSLEMYGAVAPEIERLRAMPRLMRLVLLPNTFIMHVTTNIATEAIIKTAASTLESLVLGHALPPSLRFASPMPFSCPQLHYLGLSTTRETVSQERVALMFPNLQSLEIKTDSATEGLVETDRNVSRHFTCPIKDCGSPSRIVFQHLRSFTGLKELALSLSRYHSLQRLVFNQSLSTITEFSVLSNILRNLAIRSLTLSVELYSPRLDVEEIPLLSMLPFARHLTYFSLCIGRMDYEVCCEFIDSLAQAAPILTSDLHNLKFFGLRIETSRHSSLFKTCHHVIIPLKLDIVINAWSPVIPSLQYLELDVDHAGLGHDFWRISPGQGASLQVSEEEGLSVRSWYDTEEWK